VTSVIPQSDSSHNYINFQISPASGALCTSLTGDKGCPLQDFPSCPNHHQKYLRIRCICCQVRVRFDLAGERNPCGSHNRRQEPAPRWFCGAVPGNLLGKNLFARNNGQVVSNRRDANVAILEPNRPENFLYLFTGLAPVPMTFCFCTEANAGVSG
jgi:hypothetical protein